MIGTVGDEITAALKQAKRHNYQLIEAQLSAIMDANNLTMAQMTRRYAIASDPTTGITCIVRKTAAHGQPVGTRVGKSVSTKVGMN
jgi:hypothetical protein